MAGSAEYSLILCYPTEKSEITGISSEHWHYRSVGLDASGEIAEQSIYLEEYLALDFAR